MTENMGDNGCLQRDSAEYEEYAKASRSFNRILFIDQISGDEIRIKILSDGVNFCENKPKYVMIKDIVFNSFEFQKW